MAILFYHWKEDLILHFISKFHCSRLTITTVTMTWNYINADFREKIWENIYVDLCPLVFIVIDFFRNNLTSKTHVCNPKIEKYTVISNLTWRPFWFPCFFGIKTYYFLKNFNWCRRIILCKPSYQFSWL